MILGFVFRHRNCARSHYLRSNLRLLLLFSILAPAMALPAAAQGQARQLTLRLGDVSVNKLPFVLAYEEGIYRKNGLNVMPKFTPGSVATIRRSGVVVPAEFILRPGDHAPLGVGGSGPTIVGIATRAGAQPGPIILGSTHTRSRWRIISGPDITRPEQLKGKRIGYSGYGAVSHFMAIQFAEVMGWDPRFDVSLMRDGLGTEALKKGYIDAMIGPELHATMGIYQDDLHVAADLADYNLPVAGSAMRADRDWVRNNPELARAFVKSGIDALAVVHQDKQAVFRTLRKWYQLQDRNLMEMLYLEVKKLPRKPYPPYEGVKMIMRIYDSHAMRQYTPEYFYDDTFVREFDQSGYIDSLYQR